MDVDGQIDDLIEREGGYVNHPADKGGPTRYGITEAVARAHGYAGAMAQLPREEAAAIYRRLYWLRPRFDQVAERCPKLAAELFDTGANMGPAVASTFLQRTRRIIPIWFPTGASDPPRLRRSTHFWRFAAATAAKPSCSAHSRRCRENAICA